MDEDNTENGPRKPRKERKPPKKITPDYLHNSGLHYLQRFPASSGHFRTVMMRKVDRSCHHHTTQDREECAKMVDALVEKFTGMGLLNDEGYSRGMVTSLRRRGLSARAINAKLSARGLSRDRITHALAEHDDERTEPELVAALRLARRKRLGPFSGQERQEKDLATLARAGFSYDIASRVTSMDAVEAEEILLTF